MTLLQCTQCSFTTENLTQQGCTNCDAPLVQAQKATESTPPPPPVTTTDIPGQTVEMHRHPLQFHGQAGEFFRIWIVNLFLTIVTFGIYAAWAKVRTNRYFYTNTELAGHSFDYLAKPTAILKGNLLVMVGLIIYLSLDNYNPLYSLIFFCLIMPIVPFFIYASLRFRARNSAFRNIRFHFNGTVKDSYFSYLLLPLLLMFSGGLLYPYWAFAKKKYFYANFTLGKATNIFTGSPSYFYLIYLVFSGIIAAIAVGVVIAFGATFFTFPDLANAFSHLEGDETQQSTLALILGFGAIVVYLVIILLSVLLHQYLYSRMTNYCLINTRLDKVGFDATIKARKLIFITVTNLLAILLSFGLLVPWAKIRRTRYILDNITVTTTGSLDDFHAAQGGEASALGESAMEHFDFEIGL